MQWMARGTRPTPLRPFKALILSSMIVSVCGTHKEEGRVNKQTRLEAARQTLAGARTLSVNDEFRGCVSRCYYAAYQAMWATVGEPPKKPRWEHFGLIQTFVRGKWLDPHVTLYGPGVLESQRFALRRLYDLRLGADYRLDNISQKDADWAIETVQAILSIIEQKEQ
jgi:uncharacterized protein (UPF0332 family)